MFCKKCGAENANGARFCTRCGNDMTSANNANNANAGYSAPNYSVPNYGSAGYGMPVTNRNIVTAIILSIVTCGIYGIIWFISLTDDTNTALGENDTSGGMAFLLSLVTCGIYSYFWAYKQGEKLDKLATMKGQPTSSRGILYLILSFLGLGIVAYALMQDSLNKLAA